MSSRSNYSVYESASTAAQRRSTNQSHEAEVDNLTDLLVHSMDPSFSDADTFGIGSFNTSEMTTFLFLAFKSVNLHSYYKSEIQLVAYLSSQLPL